MIIDVAHLCLCSLIYKHYDIWLHSLSKLLLVSLTIRNLKLPIAPNTVFNLLASYNLTPNKKKKNCYTGYVMILYS